MIAEFRPLILAMTDPIAQRYTFARYVLGEDRLSSSAIAGALQHSMMDEREYDYLVERWAAYDKSCVTSLDTRQEV